MRPKVYIDGREGTTGLQIAERLSGRRDIELLLIDEDRRKDVRERRKFLNQADLVFLCLPDAAAEEAAGLIENPETRVIDASTAHRTAPGWVYGFPELSPDRRAQIARSARVANPGCHASGFISIVYPLIAAGLLPRDAQLSCFSLTGYSGGGRKMIAQYESGAREEILGSPGIYGLGQSHKHLPEMQQVCGLAVPPVFCPVVADYDRGMATTVAFHASWFRRPVTRLQVLEQLRAYYAQSGGVVRVAEQDGGTIYAGAMSGRDDLVLTVAGGDDRFTVTALFDNLGKGASGAAVQNMNLMLGFAETAGLNL